MPRTPSTMPDNHMHAPLPDQTLSELSAIFHHMIVLIRHFDKPQNEASIRHHDRGISMMVHDHHLTAVT